MVSRGPARAHSQTKIHSRTENDGDFMRAVIRTYSGPGAKKLFAELEKNKAKVETLMKPVKGLVGCCARQHRGWRNVGDGLKDQKGIDDSVRIRAEWIKENLPRSSRPSRRSPRARSSFLPWPRRLPHPGRYRRTVPRSASPRMRQLLSDGRGSGCVSPQSVSITRMISSSTRDSSASKRKRPPPKSTRMSEICTSSSTPASSARCAV